MSTTTQSPAPHSPSRLKVLFPEHEQAYFDESKTRHQIEDRYVVWIDVMGAKAAMERSLAQAANFFAKVHDAVLRAAPRSGIEVVPITDGVFLLSQSQIALQDTARLVMMRVCAAFVHEGQQEHRFMVRGGVAAGKVLLGRDMSAGFKVPQDAVHHARQLPVGVAIGQAYDTEHEAPPFGFHVHASARVKSGDLPAWPHDASGLWSWWNSRDSDDIDRAKLFGSELATRFSALKPGTPGAYDTAKMNRDAQRAKHYFPP
jgi:hypothetical protein